MTGTLKFLPALFTATTLWQTPILEEALSSCLVIADSAFFCFLTKPARVLTSICLSVILVLLLGIKDPQNPLCRETKAVFHSGGISSLLSHSISYSRITFVPITIGTSACYAVVGTTNARASTSLSERKPAIVVTTIHLRYGMDLPSGPLKTSSSISAVGGFESHKNALKLL